MNSVDFWESRLNRDRIGIWSLLIPRGSSFPAESLAASAPRDVETEVLYLSKRGEELKFSSKNGERVGCDIREIVSQCIQEAQGLGRQGARIVIADFQGADAREQCALVKTARGVQESTTELSCQFVFLGQWGYYAFRSAYRESYGHTVSPPAHSKDIIQIPKWKAEDVLQLLADKRLTRAYPTDIERVAAEFVVEQTGGDELLIRCAVEYLEQLRGDWTTDIEQVLDVLTEAAVVVNEVTARIDSLDDDGRHELGKILRVQRVIRHADDPTAEQLWVAGLVLRRELGSGKQCVHIAGPMVNTVVRRIIHGRTPGAVALPDDLCFERETLSSAAYRKIAQIEMLLRNLVVQQWYPESGSDWQSKLAFIKRLSRQESSEEDVRQLVAALVHSQLAQSGLASPDLPEPETQPSPQPKEKTKESLLALAEDWQARQRDHHGVELARDNLMQFLTTEALMSVLIDKRNGLCGEGKPFSRKEYLVTALEEYIAIRSAVAHNQALKLSTIARLDELHRKFVEWLTVYADQQTQDPANPRSAG